MAEQYYPDAEVYKQLFPRKWAKGELIAGKMREFLSDFTGESWDRAVFAAGIVFPDLMKHSLFRFILESVLSTLMTVFTGHHSLSIGLFQMKLECACEIEKYLLNHRKQSEKYKKICFGGKHNYLDMILRNNRLLIPKTAILYVDAFLEMFYDIYIKDNKYETFDTIFRNEYFFSHTAVAYSSGHHLNVEERLARMDIANYPYGWNHPRSHWNYQHLSFCYWKTIKSSDGTGVRD